jgi:hypothetical protein
MPSFSSVARRQLNLVQDLLTKIYKRRETLMWFVPPLGVYNIPDLLNRLNVNVDSQNIPGATLKRRVSCVISVYLWFESRHPAKWQHKYKCPMHSSPWTKKNVSQYELMYVGAGGTQPRCLVLCLVPGLRPPGRLRTWRLTWGDK